MNMLLALALTAATVQGTTRVADGILPGCEVSLRSSAGIARKTVSNEHGVYRFEQIPPDQYTLQFELGGFKDVERRVTVVDGTNDLGTETLQLAEITEEIVMACSLPCWDDPETMWERPSCRDYDLDTALIAALEGGDASALSALRQRHETAFTFEQKHRIAAALMSRDARYYRELAGHAQNALRFHPPEMREALDAWSAERKYDPEAYLLVATNAIDRISADPRSRGLLLEALKSNDSYILYLAIFGLARQQHEAALPAIEKALTRLGDDAGHAPYALARFRSEAADRIAWQFLDEDSRQSYESFRELPRPQP